MTIREDFDKLIDEVKEHIEDFETHHDEKVIAREERDIKKDEHKADEHTVKLDDDKKDKQGFIKKEEEKFEEHLIKHDDKEEVKREAKIAAEQKKEDAHEAAFYKNEEAIEKIDAAKEAAKKAEK